MNNERYLCKIMQLGARAANLRVPGREVGVEIFVALLAHPALLAKNHVAQHR